MCPLDIRLLARLGSTSDQQDQCRPVLCKKDAITLLEMQTPLENSFTD
jgi:hypothetical protein